MESFLKPFLYLRKIFSTFQYFGYWTGCKIILSKIFRISLNAASGDSSQLNGPSRIAAFDLNQQYQLWRQKLAYDPACEKQYIRETSAFSYRPSFSIVMPVYNPELVHLTAAVDSCLNQVYPDWELCICDDGSESHIIDYLKAVKEKYPNRIYIDFHQDNSGIAQSSNDALALASGDYIALLDHDDMLAPHALFSMARRLNQNPELDFIYSDEDKIAPNGIHLMPFFKPDWSIHTFRSVMYTCHLGIYRHEIVKKIGGFRPGVEGAQDYDFVLRFTRHTDKIAHIPDMLYHWRMAPNSTANAPEAKNYAYVSAKKALSESVESTGLKCDVTDGICIGNYRVRYTMDECPGIGIVIPNKNSFDTLERCLKSIQEKTSYPNYHIYIIDHESDEPALEELYRQYELTVIPYQGEFNFAKMNNSAVKKVSEPYVLFLNNDIEAISEQWLFSMAELLVEPKVAAVGAKLLYPDRTIQHGGLILGINSLAGSCCKGFPVQDHGYFNQLSIIKECSAVTAACALVRKSAFLEINGFDQEHFKVSFNDVDLCLRLRQAGYHVLYTPYAMLYHWESKTRGYNNNPLELKEEQNLKDRWARMLADDPFYNRNLTFSREDFSLNVLLLQSEEKG